MEWRSAIADAIVETHDRIVGKTWREAKSRCDAHAEDAKAALKDMENAPKMVQNAELKTWAENLVKTLKANAEEIDTKFKEEKKRK